MSFLAKVTDFVGGSLFSEAKDLITEYFPPDMTDAQKKEFELKFRKLEAEKTAALFKHAADADKLLNERINTQEGTASDLKQLPLVGRVVLFLRGTQRPIWGFFTMFADYVWFTSPSSKLVDGVAVPVFTEHQQLALIVINILVLTFLFGERAIKNLEPLIIRVFSK